jgi:hypothetical protein
VEDFGSDPSRVPGRIYIFLRASVSTLPEGPGAAADRAAIRMGKSRTRCRAGSGRSTDCRRRPGHPGKVYRWGPSPRAQANPAFQVAVKAGTIVGASARPPTADDLRSMPSPARSPAACEKLPRAGTSMGDLYFGIL